MDCRYTGVECRRRAAVEELRPGGSFGVYSWIEGASGDEGGFLGLSHKTKEADGG